MGTRSILAVPYGDGWRGRYCHWDGYPTHNGARIWALVQEHGLDEVARMLVIDHYGWSSLSERSSRTPLGDGYDDGRFALVDGYGVAYTTEEGQSDPDEWITHDGDKWGTEWLYVLAKGGLMVAKVSFSDEVEFLGTFRWDGPEPDWSAIESRGYEEAA